MPVSDVQYLRWWGERLDALLSRDDLRDGQPWNPSRFDAMIFRPDVDARAALTRMALKYPQLHVEMREAMERAEWAFADFIRLLPPPVCSACGKADYWEEDES